MSLRGCCEKRTLCEVLREINDTLQGSALHKQILPKLVEAESMGKRMAKKLEEYNKQVFAGWWADNPDYDKDLQRRMNENYIS
jgi:hypothetical protein